MGRLRDLWFGAPERGSGDPRGRFHSPAFQSVYADALKNDGAAGVALSVGAVYRAHQLITDTVMSTPWAAQRGGPTNLTRQRELERARVLDTQPAILVQPDPFISRNEHLQRVIESLLWRGNAYLYLTGHSEGRPTVTMAIHPDEMTVSSDRYNRARYTWREQPMILGENLAHIRLATRLGPLGVAPLEAAARAILGAKATEDYARDLFESGAVPSGTLTHPARLNAEEARELRDLWEESHEGGRGTGVLSGGLAWEQISMTPEQGQFLATRAFDTQTIARFYGIPPEILNAGTPPGTSSSLTYQNAQQITLAFAKLTLYPVYFARLEDTYSGFLPRGQAVRFDLGELVRADFAARADFYEKAIGAGWMTVDEVREAEELPEGRLPTATAPAPAAVPTNGGIPNA